MQIEAYNKRVLRATRRIADESGLDREAIKKTGFLPKPVRTMTVSDEQLHWMDSACGRYWLLQRCVEARAWLYSAIVTRFSTDIYTWTWIRSSLDAVPMAGLVSLIHDIQSGIGPDEVMEYLTSYGRYESFGKLTWKPNEWMEPGAMTPSLQV